MSNGIRWASDKSNKLGLYPTDVGLIREQIFFALETGVVQEEPIRVLDLCAGWGGYGICAREALQEMGFSDIRVTFVEINPAFQKPPGFVDGKDSWVIADATKPIPGKFHFGFSNPDFKIAGEIGYQLNSACQVSSLLCPAYFPFSNKGGRGKLFDEFGSPDLTVQLMERAGFYFLFGEKMGLKQPRQKSAKEYCIFQWDGQGSRIVRLNDWTDGEKKSGRRYARFKRFDSGDPVWQTMSEHPSAVICALTHEASLRRREDENANTFDSQMAFAAANEYGWKFFEASDSARLALMED